MPPPAPATQAAYVSAAPAVPPKKKHTLLWVVIAVIVIIVVIVIAASAFFVAATSVDVTAINYTSSDNACGTNGGTALGFTTGSNAAYQATIIVTNSNIILSCTINSVSTTTSGFSISGANVPLTIPAGGTESVSFTIHTPGGSYTGVLTLDFE
jgi:hypothetical protein